MQDAVDLRGLLDLLLLEHSYPRLQEILHCVWFKLWDVT